MVLGRWLVVLLEHRRILVVLRQLRLLHGVRRRLVVLGRLLLVVVGRLLLVVVRRLLLVLRWHGLLQHGGQRGGGDARGGQGNATARHPRSPHPDRDRRYPDP